MTKKSGQKYIILRIKRAFKVKLKAVFIILKGLSVAKNCLRPKSAALNLLENVFFTKAAAFAITFFFWLTLYSLLT